MGSLGDVNMSYLDFLGPLYTSSVHGLCPCFLLAPIYISDLPFKEEIRVGRLLILFSYTYYFPLLFNHKQSILQVFPLKAELLKPQEQMERHITDLVKKVGFPSCSLRHISL